MQDKVEQQHLKRLVLNYEQREEAEELKGTGFHSLYRSKAVLTLYSVAMESRRQGPIKIRLAG